MLGAGDDADMLHAALVLEGIEHVFQHVAVEANVLVLVRSKRPGAVEDVRRRQVGEGDNRLIPLQQVDSMWLDIGRSKRWPARGAVDFPAAKVSQMFGDV
ncbi:hypothetical protein D9M70_636440 [compost metagenome]